MARYVISDSDNIGFVSSSDPVYIHRLVGIKRESNTWLIILLIFGS